MNYYIKMLLHLKQFEGDGKLHPMRSVFIELAPEFRRSIFKELYEEDLIVWAGEELEEILNDVSRKDECFISKIINSAESQYWARITFKGSKYLKEELEMLERGKYNSEYVNSLVPLIKTEAIYG